MEPSRLSARLTGMTSATSLALLAASLLLATGCGSNGAGEDAATDSGPSNGATTGGTALTIVVREGPENADRSTYSLRCDPAGGDHPDPEAACRLLSTMEEPFAPVPADQMCAQIYGGPQTAEVTGTFRGQPVNAQFSRTDGCEIARWDEHVPLLLEPGGGEGTG